MSLWRKFAGLALIAVGLVTVVPIVAGLILFEGLYRPGVAMNGATWTIMICAAVAGLVACVVGVNLLRSHRRA